MVNIIEPLNCEPIECPILRVTCNGRRCSPRPQEFGGMSHSNDCYIYKYKIKQKESVGQLLLVELDAEML